MSSFPGGCGGGRAYGIGLDAVARSWSSSPTTSTWSTHSPSSSASSPSSTLSESRSHPLAISTKRARAPRKRPNQAYNEAAALLATAYPTVFSAKGLLEMCKKKSTGPFHAEPTADLLLPACPGLGGAGFLLQEYVPGEQRLILEPSRPASSSERSWTCPSPTSIDFQEPTSPAEVINGDGFDADSILDEVDEMGIDSILGALDMNSNGTTSSSNEVGPYLWNPTTAGGRGDRKDMRGALRRGSQDGEWWRCRTVEVLEINPELNLAPPAPPSTTKKKKKKKEKRKVLPTTTNKAEEHLTQQRTAAATAANSRAGLGLKLDYEEVLAAWSGRGSPFSAARESSESTVDATVRF